MLLINNLIVEKINFFFSSSVLSLFSMLFHLMNAIQISTKVIPKNMTHLSIFVCLIFFNESNVIMGPIKSPKHWFI